MKKKPLEALLASQSFIDFEQYKWNKQFLALIWKESYKCALQVRLKNFVLFCFVALSIKFNIMAGAVSPSEEFENLYPYNHISGHIPQKVARNWIP